MIQKEFDMDDAIKNFLRELLRKLEEQVTRDKTNKTIGDWKLISDEGSQEAYKNKKTGKTIVGNFN